MQMNHFTRNMLMVVACFPILLLAGCGSDGPELGQVSGTITLDNQPLADAWVEFQPVEMGGSPSSDTTDENGQYELQFAVDRKGAMIGKHRVRVTTFRQIPTDDGGGEVAERVPPKYNSKTELIEEVVPGSQTIDLTLEGALP